MDMITLKNGKSEASGLVTSVMVSLNGLMKSNPMAVYELNEVCKNVDHKIFGNLGRVLVDRALLGQDEKPHGCIRNIVLSAVSGEGLEMTIGSPI